MSDTVKQQAPAWQVGMRESLPLLGGYIPVAVSFGLTATQAGLSALEATIISFVIYAGASQFLFVGMIATGAPLWLIVSLTLLINLRHVVYAPPLAPWLSSRRRWAFLMHGLTDQIFAVAHARLPYTEAHRRTGWFTGAALLAWLSWSAGTLLGAVAGEWLTSRWPLLGEIMPFALPALFLVLIVPRLTSLRWSVALTVSTLAALVCTLWGQNNLAIPLAALLGMLCYYLTPLGRRGF